MSKILTFMLLAFASLTSQAQQTATHKQANKQQIHPYAGPHIQVKGETLFFNTYEQWLQQTFRNSNKHVVVDKFQRRVDPRLYKRLQKNTVSHWIEYESDGLKISGVLAYPKHSELEKLPVVIFNRGGNAKSAANPRWSHPITLLPLAEQGYLVLASNYRGSKFSEGKDEFGGQDVNDVVRLLELVKTIPKADAERVAMMGWSRGAMMTMQAARQFKPIKALVSVAGVYDYGSHIEYRPNMGKLIASYSPEFNKNRQQALEQRSALYWADELDKKVPILLMHGTQDWRVEFSQSQMFADKLKQLGHPYQFEVFEEGDHGLTFYQQEWQQALFAFLKQNL